MGSIVLYSLFHCDSGKCGNLVKTLATSYIEGLGSPLGCSGAANFVHLKKCYRERWYAVLASENLLHCYTVGEDSKFILKETKEFDCLDSLQRIQL
jgi:hypothetical protein